MQEDIKQKSLVNNIDTLQSKLNTFLQENNMSLGAEVSFSQYRELPDDVKLALKVMENHKGKIIVVIKDIKDGVDDKK